MSDKLIATIAAQPKVSREVHLPVQSGDDELLSRMNRGYTVGDYRTLVRKLRTAIPEVKLSTDIIVGFPGETEAQFENTLALVRECGFSRVNTAAYSPRPLTAAAKMADQLTAAVKAERLQRLMKALA
jgi:tRNA A37 methylthiotransferase MiaB